MNPNNWNKRKMEGFWKRKEEIFFKKKEWFKWPPHHNLKTQAPKVKINLPHPRLNLGRN